MNHLISISWAQSILIYVGALLQVAAIIALIKQKSGYRMLPRHGEEMRHVEHEEMVEIHHEEEDPAREFSDRTERPARWQPTVKAGNLTKTSKAPFKQTFKFRQ